MAGRSVPEWVGKNPDTKVPPRVRDRIFERCGGVCHISGRKIRAGEKWELEHIEPLALGGEHRELNMAPALVAPHKEKTRQERRLKAKEDRKRKKHLGIHKSRFTLPGGRDSKFKRKVDGTVVLRDDD